MEKLLKAIQDLEAKIKDKDTTSEEMQKVLNALQEKYDSLEALLVENNRPNITKTKKVTKGFINYIKTGDIDNALIESDETSGGVLVPDDIVSGIDHELAETSAIAEISDIRTTSQPTVVYHQRISGFAGGHVGETDERSETDSAKYEDIEINLRGIYADPAVSNNLLMDSDEDIEGEISQGIGEGLSEILADDFINGDGTKGPKGILSYSQNKISKKSDMTYGKLNFLATGKDKALADAKPWAVFSKAKNVLHRRYLKNSYWVMNSNTSTELDTMVDANGNPLWKESNNLIKGSPSTFMGIEVKPDESMPDISSGEVFAILINKKSYQIVKHKKATFLRDPFTKHGFTKFYVEQRWGGGIRRFKSLVGIKGATA